MPTPRLFLFVGALLVAACTPPTGTADAELVTSFRADPVTNTFEQPVDIRYRLTRPAVVTLRVTTDAEQPQLVALLTEDQRETGGTHHAAWVGTGPDGFFVPKGHYRIELFARLRPDDTPHHYTLPVYIFRN